jgi:hypothetical protein
MSSSVGWLGVRVAAAPVRCNQGRHGCSLSEAHGLRFANLIQDYAREAQFLIITRNKRRMEKADLLYGVTMEFGDEAAEAIA